MIFFKPKYRYAQSMNKPSVSSNPSGSTKKQQKISTSSTGQESNANQPKSNQADHVALLNTVNSHQHTAVEQQTVQPQTLTASSAAATASPAPNQQHQHNSSNKINPKSSQSNRPMRHYSNCPLFYLNINPNSTNRTSHPNTHHNHPHHAHTGTNKASYYHIPNLFQNSFKVPLHFRNVYYYKSLLNLNMRLVVLRPHGAGALTITNSGANNRVQNNSQNNQNNVSLSCPDLNLRQLLVVNSTKRDERSSAVEGSNANNPVLTIKDFKGSYPLEQK